MIAPEHLNYDTIEYARVGIDTVFRELNAVRHCPSILSLCQKNSAITLFAKTDPKHQRATHYAAEVLDVTDWSLRGWGVGGNLKPETRN